ncbi:MAG TPA: 2Fe-2S iron-sulfur cluster-binding protein [Clostridiales bacterium]|jgi:ferredoxin-NADP reductase|nr:2Fe-2S iron-sulfur cluster-binding protein [Clostridiales bacterium]
MSKNKVVVRSTLGDLKKFASIVSTRKGIIESASQSPLLRTYGVNETAKALHPPVLHLIVKKVVPMGGGVKSFVLTNNLNKGTQALPYFKAGQYIGLSFKIGNSFVTRPYSIVSSPALALKNNEYIITVKPKYNGFASSYILNNWRTGTAIDAVGPYGNFCYSPIRDEKTILGVAGGSGVSPFISLAQAIADGTEDVDLILLYGCRKLSDATFKPLLDELMQSCKRVKAVYVFSDEKVDKCERGFVSRAIIEKYAPERYSLFVCGPASLYRFIASEVSLMDIERKNIRFEVFDKTKNLGSFEEFIEEKEGKEFYLTVYKRGDIIAELKCHADESILAALERGGVAAHSLCRSGECGFCRSKLTAGEVFIPKETDKRRMADAKYNIIHPCCTYPASDVAIEIF